MAKLITGDTVNAWGCTGRSFRHNYAVAGVIPGSRSIVEIPWLKDAAKVYEISPYISDYVFYEVPVVTSDLPNRNCQAFTREELFRFDPLLGRCVYRTFVGKPVHVKHKSEDPTKAIGVIFDAVIKRIEPYDIYKVVVLVGVDRNKHTPPPAKESAWSMGALVEMFVCSVCGANITNDFCDCFKQIGKGGIFFGRKLVYELCYGVNFVEISLVDQPADVTAWGLRL